MRGIHHLTPPDLCDIRITPAHAGNTTMAMAEYAWTRDHPRACGEYCNIVRSADMCIGSPPRMRGILSCILSLILMSGITPAHAGNTLPGTASDSVVRDHPRACGEYNFERCKRAEDMGSPPRMRGIRPFPLDLVRRMRITPAHAGNTTFSIRFKFKN